MAAYPNRTDLATQPVKAAPNQPYGQRGRQEAAQRAVPLPAPGALGAVAPQVPFDAPTGRPAEPVTHGVPTGPGPGPAEAGVPQGPIPATSVPEQLRAIYSVYPTDDLLDLIMALENQ